MAACPICGGTEFVDWRKRGPIRCGACDSMPRTRAAWLLLNKIVRPGPRSRMAHWAPEKGIAPRLAALMGKRYHPFDLAPKKYNQPGVQVKKFDLLKDIDTLADDHYDILMHNHVLEHLPTNYTLVLQNLHRKLKRRGHHIFSVPIFEGFYRADFDPGMTSKERLRLFNQRDHIHRFGTRDFEHTLGAVFGIRQDYSLADLLPAEDLIAASVPPSAWTVGGGTVFYVRKA